MSKEMDGLLDALSQSNLERDVLLETLHTVELAVASGDAKLINGAVCLAVETAREIRGAVNERRQGVPAPSDADAQITVLPCGKIYKGGRS